MTSEIALLLAILAVAMVLFSFEWISADVVGLGVLLTLIITGLLPADRAFAGFGSDAVMLILGLLIMTAALLRTGVVEMAGRAILQRSGDDPDRLLLIIMLAVATLSAFISNTAATAFFLPITVGIAARAKQSPSKYLLPLAFASILTSSVTLVSTSTNIVVSGLISQYDMPPMGMFELAPVGIPIAVVGIGYMWFIGRRLLPTHTIEDASGTGFGARVYLTEVIILADSPLVGKTLAESGLGQDLDLTVLRVVRDKDRYLLPRPTTRLQAEDVLLVEGKSDEILKIKEKAGIDIKADVKLSDPSLQEGEAVLVEAILLPRSPLIGRTLKAFRFRERYGLQVLAINRLTGTIQRKISQIQLRMGDTLLLQGSREQLAALEGGDAFRILGQIEGQRLNTRRAPLAIAIFILALVAATVNLFSLPVAMLLGALAAFVTRCITPEEAYREVEWKALILIGSMLALGTAMEATGTEKFIADWIVGLVGNLGPLWLLTGFFVLTVLLTQPMSNQAAAVVVVPVALQTATQLDLNPRTFAMMIAVAASVSYLTPLEPSCLMVYGPGRYRFIDFVRVGALLTVLIYGVAIILVPLVWPL